MTFEPTYFSFLELSSVCLLEFVYKLRVKVVSLSAETESANCIGQEVDYRKECNKWERNGWDDLPIKTERMRLWKSLFSHLLCTLHSSSYRLLIDVSQKSQSAEFEFIFPFYRDIISITYMPSSFIKYPSWPNSLLHKSWWFLPMNRKWNNRKATNPFLPSFF